jgi:CO dehydrogenase/acetyl-CoA synthase epsilon subunit
MGNSEISRVHVTACNSKFSRGSEKTQCRNKGAGVTIRLQESQGNCYRISMYIFYVNVKRRKEADSDEEMEKEIEETEETEAAVDACIFRRAKRVGVSVAGPEGRHMSEAERDLICKMIGDVPGARAKRRKEIEEMSEEDMQAEIERIEMAMNERVKPATRRGRGETAPDHIVIGFSRDARLASGGIHCL